MASKARMIAARKGMISKKKQEETKKGVIFRLENPDNIEYNDTSILYCSSVLGNLVYCPCRGNEFIISKFEEYKIKEVILIVLKNTGDAIL